MRRFSIAAMGRSSSTVFLLDESCEGTGTPSGWTDVATVSWDNTAIVLGGAQSLRCTTTGAFSDTRYDFGNIDEVYTYCLFRVTGTTPGSATPFLDLRNTAGTNAQQLFLLANMRLRLTSSAPSPATAISFDTTYHLWIRFLKGTGSDGILTIGFSTDGVRPTQGSGSYAQNLASTSTAQIGRLLLGTNLNTSTFDVIFDNIRVAATQIGDYGV